MSRDDPQMKIRLPEALKARIEESAQASGRSMNSEIAARLQQSYEGDGLVDQLRMAEYKLEQLTTVHPGDADVKLSPAIRSIVKQTAKEKNLSLGDALGVLVLAGCSRGSPAVIYFAAEPTWTAGGYADMFKAIEHHVARDAVIVIEHTGMRVQVRSDDEPEAKT